MPDLLRIVCFQANNRRKVKRPRERSHITAQQINTKKKTNKREKRRRKNSALNYLRASLLEDKSL